MVSDNKIINTQKTDLMRKNKKWSPQEEKLLVENYNPEIGIRDNAKLLVNILVSRTQKAIEVKTNLLGLQKNSISIKKDIQKFKTEHKIRTNKDLCVLLNNNGCKVSKSTLSNITLGKYNISDNLLGSIYSIMDKINGDNVKNKKQPIVEPIKDIESIFGVESLVIVNNKKDKPTTNSNIVKRRKSKNNKNQIKIDFNVDDTKIISNELEKQKTNDEMHELKVLVDRIDSECVVLRDELKKSNEEINMFKIKNNTLENENSTLTIQNEIKNRQIFKLKEEIEILKSQLNEKQNTEKKSIFSKLFNI